MLDILLEAIRDNPDDDLPRLALGDWCLEQNNRHLFDLFIDIQHERHGVWPNPPALLVSPRELHEPCCVLEAVGRRNNA